MTEKVAIVTGASSGIGAATARELARRGWRVAINFSKDSVKAGKVASECKEAAIFQGDVSQDADCRRVAKEVLAKWGRIDALVNNAGATRFVKHSGACARSARERRRAGIREYAMAGCSARRRGRGAGRAPLRRADALETNAEA
jgi:NAD(P)-dependent dehydrogenase (short-subunit alcohol dehydrogenase family)